MFYRKSAECPFCLSDDLRVSVRANDMPQPGDGGFSVNVFVVCNKCEKTLFDVRSYRDRDQITAQGVSICESCKHKLREQHQGSRAEDTPKTVYEIGTRDCPKCGTPLRPVWWRGSNYTL